MMEEGMQLFFRGLRQEMEPALRDLEGLTRELGPPMQRFLAEMGPALAEILSHVDDWTRYETPQILPNGDIIIRRKPEPETGPETGPKDIPEKAPAPAKPTDL